MSHLELKAGQPLLSMRLCAPSMGAVQMGFKSPVRETMKVSTSRSQGREGDRASEGRLCESHEPMNKNPIGGRRGRVSWHNTAKSGCFQSSEVNGVVVWQRTALLPGEVCPTWRPALGRGAPWPAMARVIGQKSAEMIVVRQTSRGCGRSPVETVKPEVSA